MLMRRWLGCILLGGLCVTGCQTTPKSADKGDNQPETPKVHHDFIPANFISRVVYEKGKYKNLLSPRTHAIWVDKNISEIKLAFENQQAQHSPIDEDLISDAAFISENYIVIECHIETTLPDASVAYDVSSLRNLNIYLQPSGASNFYPLQQVIASPAEEKQVGALKQFNRQNFLVFAKEDLISGQPTIPVDVSQMRLYIEGYGTTFYFEWKPQDAIVLESPEGAPPQDITDVIRWRPNQTESYQVLKVRFSDLYTKLQALTRLPQND